jgi:hypothetical protein
LDTSEISGNRLLADQTPTEPGGKYRVRIVHAHE